MNPHEILDATQGVAPALGLFVDLARAICRLLQPTSGPTSYQNLPKTAEPKNCGLQLPIYNLICFSFCPIIRLIPQSFPIKSFVSCLFPIRAAKPTDFQDRRIKPLSHPSFLNCNVVHAFSPRRKQFGSLGKISGV
jgi:hypothetical protein